jgi:hypothetical protein
MSCCFHIPAAKKHIFSAAWVAQPEVQCLQSHQKLNALPCAAALPLPRPLYIYIHRYIYIYHMHYIYIIYIYINICHQYIAKRLPRDQRRSSIVDLQSSSLYSRMWPQGPKGQSMAKHCMSSLDQRHSQNCNPTIHTLQNYSKLTSNIINSPLFLAIYCNRLFEFYFISQSSPLATWHWL